MKQLSRSQKWLSIVVMLAVVAGAVYGTLVYSPDLQELGEAYGPAGHAPQMYLWGADIVVCIGIWVATYLVCAVIQRSLDVWQGFNLLPVLLLAVLGANFAPQLAEMAGYHWSPVSGYQTLRALKQDNVASIIENDNACQAELDRLGYPKFMRPFSLGETRGPQAAREKLKKTRAVLQACEQRDAAQAAKFQQAVEGLRMTAHAKRETLATGKDSADTDRTRLRQIDVELIAEYERTLDDLAASKAGWYAEGYHLAFYRKRDLDTFTAHEMAAKKLTDERAAVTERLWARKANP